MRMLTSYAEQKRAIYQDSSKVSVGTVMIGRLETYTCGQTFAQQSTAAKEIQVDGAKLEDLCLDFTLPGDSSYELKVSDSAWYH